MFADDTNFFIQGENDFNIELKKPTVWLKTNTLSLNINKTISNTHSIRTKHNKIYIHGTEIDTVNKKNKKFGIVMNTKLNWSEHIEHICSKISQRVLASLIR